jgi:hypothetical protein
MAVVDPFADVVPQTDLTVTVPKPEAQPDAFANVVALSDDPFANVTESVEGTSTLDQLSYGFDKVASATGNLSILLQSMYPIGEIRADLVEPTEDNPFQMIDFSILPAFDDTAIDKMYGAPFSEMSFEQRVDFLKQRREEEIAADNEAVIAAGETDTLAANLGGLGGAVLDPALALIPMGAAYKTMAAVGGLIGIGSDVLSQAVEDPTLETYDPTQTAVVGGVSAIAAPAVGFALRKSGEKISKLNQLRKTKKEAKQIKKADNAIDELNTIAARGVTEGVKKADIPAYVRQQSGLTEGEVAELVGQSTKPFQIPTRKEAKQIASIQEFQADPITTPLKKSSIADWLGVMHSSLKKVSPKLAIKLREFETRQHLRAANGLEIIEPFSRQFGKLSKSVQRQASLYLNNGDFDAARNLFTKYNPELVSSFKAVDDYLQNTYGELVKYGYNVTKIPNYFPRVVKDLDQLQTKLSGKQLSEVQKVWKQKSKQLGRALSDNEKRLIISEMIQGRKVSFTKDGKKIIITPGARGSGAPSSTKQRMLGQLDERLLDEYEDPISALHHYVKQTSHDMERRRFFGTGRSNRAATEINTDESIDNLVLEELNAGRLNYGDLDRVSHLLKIRFGAGEKAAHGVLQDIRNINYMTTIGDPLATLTQIGDLGVAAYYNGIGNTIRALIGKKDITIKQLGLEDVIAAEMMSSRRLTSRVLDTLLKGTGFKAIDRLGKETLINGSLRKAQQMSKSAKGIEQLRKKYGEVYGDEFDLFVNDLRAGTISDNVKMYVFNELANVQPITLSEMPVKYLESPTGRVFYQLKSYVIKQLDLVKNDIITADIPLKDKVAKGMVYAAIVPTTNVATGELKDAFLKRNEPLDVDSFTDKYIENVAKFLMVSEYTYNTAVEQGKAGEALKDTVLGGWGVLADNVTAVSQDFKQMYEGTLDLESSKVMARAPAFGRFWYNYIGGGLEKYEAKKFQEDYGFDKNALDEYGLTPKQRKDYGL